MLIKCSPIVSTVQKRAIVINPRAGQNTHVSSFAITLLALSVRILHFVNIKPTAIHIKSVSMGVRVAVNVVIGLSS